MTFKSIAIAAALTFSSTAFAANNARIHGIQSGKLTRGELAVLQADKTALSRAKAAALRDGRISAREWVQIKAMERQLERKTQALMTNRVRR